MTNCTSDALPETRVNRRQIQVDFEGGNITSDGGVMLLRQANERINLLERVAPGLPDPRIAAYIEHPMVALLKQRVYGLCLGYEDLNDHETMRHDIALQTAIGRDVSLAGDSTLSRFENWMDRRAVWHVHSIMFDVFVESFKTPPEELVLDLDATDNEIHGEQVGRHFHGYYDSYCFLPLYVYCGKHLLVAYLRRSCHDGAYHAGAVIRLLVNRIRKIWPSVKIMVRGDSGFCRKHILTWCERNNVQYVFGLAGNKRLESRVSKLSQRAERLYKKTGENQRWFGWRSYGAKSWGCERDVMCPFDTTGVSTDRLGVLESP